MTHYIVAVGKDENTKGEQRNNDELVTGPPPALKKICVVMAGEGKVDPDRVAPWRFR